MPATSYRRSAQADKRQVRRTLTVANAAEALGVVDEAFAHSTGAAAVGAKPAWNKATLDALGKVSDAAGALARRAESGPYGRDVRRTGLSWD